MVWRLAPVGEQREGNRESQITVDLKKSGSEFGTGGRLLFHSTSSKIYKQCDLGN